MPRRRVHPSRGRRVEAGTAAVEFALVLPLLLVIALALVQVGLVIRDRLLVEEAARAHGQAAAEASALAAAQELALADGRDPADLAAEYAARNGASLVSCDCAPAGSEATVLVTMPVGGLFLLDDGRTVTAAARAL